MDAGPDPRALDAAGRLGQVLKDKWRLDDLLGVGGMAAVYAATHRNGKRVAIKMLHREYSIDAEVKARFLREGYLVNKVIHPGVVGVLDDDSGPDGAVFLVMDLLEGESLEQRRNRKGGSLPAAEVLSVADQVLDVLASAHEVGMVHRDMKPENLFLCRDGAVKVLDFGIARLRELSARIGATQNGSTTMGTPAFMPPEQARGAWDTVDGRTDLWGLGASMLTMLTNTIVHDADNLGDLLVAAMTKPAPSLAERLPGAPKALVDVVDRALAFDQKDRWPDARVMQAAVREAYRAIVNQTGDVPRLAVSIVDQAPPEMASPAPSLELPVAAVVSQPFSSPPHTPVMQPIPPRYPADRPSGAAPIPISFGPPPVMPYAPQAPPVQQPSPVAALPFVPRELPGRPPVQAWLLLVAGALLSGLVGLLLIVLLARHRGAGPGLAASASASVGAPISTAPAPARP